MLKKDQFYELIVKELTSLISKEESALLEKEMEENKGSKKKVELLKEFWTKFFPKTESHNIIELTEKKLSFSGTSFSC